MTACVISPKVSSKSAKNLADLLGINYHPAEQDNYAMYDTVINYGSSINFKFNKVINKPAAVAICVNKLSTFKRLEGKCNVIPYTKDIKVARNWGKDDGIVVARANETGSQNSGMTMCTTEEEFTGAPAKFWTKYFNHTYELRVNVFKGKLLSVFNKVRDDKKGIWNFEHIPVKTVTPQVQQMIDAISENIGIDLYGMDVLVNKTKGEYMLLEVNSGAILHDETEAPLVKALKKEL
jgi:hypothetical protein